MVDDPRPKKIPLIFFRTPSGSEPVREWLKELPEGNGRRRQGPVASAMALADSNAAVPRDGKQLWEIRTDLPTKRTARVLLCVYREHLVG